MKIKKKIQEIKEIGMSTAEKQAMISIGEAWHLWAILVERYSVRIITQIYHNFVQADDFKLVLKFGLKIIDKEIATLEEIMLNYGIPLPERPAANVNSVLKMETITDRVLFERLFIGVRDFLPTFQTAYTQSYNGKIREIFKDFLLGEIDIFDKLFEYGKLKGWIPQPPRFRL